MLEIEIIRIINRMYDNTRSLKLTLKNIYIKNWQSSYFKR